MRARDHMQPLGEFARCVASLLLFVLWMAVSTDAAFAISKMSEHQMEMDEETKSVGEKVSVSNSNERARLLWVSTVGRLYTLETLSPKDKAAFFKILDHRLGIEKNGSLNITTTRQAADQLSRYDRMKEKPFTNIYFDDKVNLTGYNYLYLETCVLNRQTETSRFVRYFENGFYPNRSLFIKEEHYYKILYYYLYLTQGPLVESINNSVARLAQNANATPTFGPNQIKGFETCVSVCTELDEFRRRGLTSKESPWDRIFTPDESAWIEATIAYFTEMDTHIALASYDWFRRVLPLSISSKVIAHNTRQTWIEQSSSHRSVLPLMLFMNKGAKEFSVEKLFQKGLSMLKLDNREVDLVVVSAMKSWLVKQIEQGIKVEDRTTYKKILDELNVCPTGWIFFNLYASREPIAAMKKHAETWESLPLPRRKEIFNSEIQTLYYTAKGHIDIVFSDLVKIFGGEQIFGSEYKASSINHIFHRYRGEMEYIYEFLQAGLYENLSEARLPLANASKSCLQDFTAAFVKAPSVHINHVNLLNAYTLLFRELAAQGKVSRITRHEEEMEELILSKRYKLGETLAHNEDNRYEIYRIISQTYLSSPRLRTRALKVASRSFDLARSYYVDAATREGFMAGSLPGALASDATEVDDFERQYEYYQAIAEKLGKKILLLLPPEDVNLYNRMQDSRRPERYTL